MFNHALRVIELPLSGNVKKSDQFRNRLPAWVCLSRRSRPAAGKRRRKLWHLKLKNKNIKPSPLLGMNEGHVLREWTLILP